MAANTSIDGTPRAVEKLDPPLSTDVEVRAVGRAVLAGTHPYVNWTHMAHCAATICLLMEGEVEDLDRQIGAIIRHYNECIGIANTSQSGYHETLTLFYLYALKDFIARQPEGSGPAAVVAALRNSPLAARDYVFGFYSREFLFTPEARAEWRAPDLAVPPFPLPL